VEALDDRSGIRTPQRIIPSVIKLCNLIQEGFVVSKVQLGCGADTLSCRETLESGGLRLDLIGIGHTFSGHFISL
jgi:hypothetical protein